MTIPTKHKNFHSAILALIIFGVGYALFCPTGASAASTWKDNISPVYFVYTNEARTAVISNKSFYAYSPAWGFDYFLPRITTDGRACNKGENDKTSRDFDSTAKFHDCEALAINADTKPSGNTEWFKNANFSYIVGDFDNAETINIGRGYIVASGRSAVGTPRGQTATAQKNARDTTGNDKYDCDHPNMNTTKNCSLLLYFTRGDAGTFHISLDNIFNNGKPSSGHEYWYDGVETWTYHTLILDPNGGSVVDNGVDTKTLIRHTDGSNALREYDANVTATGLPVPSRAGYIFRGWSKTPSGDCQASRNCVVSQPMGRADDRNGNIRLYAHWAAIVNAYVLAPHVNSPAVAVKQGEGVTFTPSVTKDNSVNSNSTSWKFCRVLVAPGVAAPAAGSVCSSPTATVVESKNNVVFNGSGPFTIGDPANYIYTVPAGTVYGSQVCYALLVDSSTQDAGHPAESVKCVIVAKSPHLQVWGNDTHVGSSFLGWDDNRVSLIDTSTGSWGEYGVLASGTINSFGSGSVANGTLLTFANRPTLGDFTQAASIESLGIIPDVQGYLQKAGNAEYYAKTGISLVDAPAAISAYAANTVYTSGGTATIDKDIINPSKGDNLSQMVIIADNINILPNVKQVDAWLIATNTINTCYLNGDTPKIGNCGDNTNASTLHINGPVMAKSLILNRTGGLDTDDNSASEVINLRGDAYIWMHKLSTETGSIRTVYTRELAPRY